MALWAHLIIPLLDFMIVLFQMQQVRVLSTTIGGPNPGTVTVLKNLAKPIQPAVQTAGLQKVQLTPKAGSILTGMNNFQL